MNLVWAESAIPQDKILRSIPALASQLSPPALPWFSDQPAPPESSARLPPKIPGHTFYYRHLQWNTSDDHRKHWAPSQVPFSYPQLNLIGLGDALARTNQSPITLYVHEMLLLKPWGPLSFWNLGLGRPLDGVHNPAIRL